MRKHTITICNITRARWPPSLPLSHCLAISNPAPKQSVWTVVEVSCFSEKAHWKWKLKIVSYTAYSCLHLEHHCIYSKEMGKYFNMLILIEWLGRIEVLANVLH